jgi:flavin reductase (DIM6/NTAB) family NADH-FMN oxidoreductase RutF
MQKINLDKAYRLLNHGPTVLVSSAHNGKKNIMAAAWVTPLDFDPPKITLVIDKNTYTRELIEASGTLAINVPCVAQIDTVRKVGTTSGRDLKDSDKFAQYGLETFPAQSVNAPLLKGCVAWLECKVIPEPHNQNTYDLYIAEVVAAYADERVFSDGRWHFDGHNDLRTLHHVAGGAFFATGDALTASV